MNTINTPFSKFKFHEDGSLLEWTWNSESRYMEDDRFKEEFKSFLEIVKQREPRKILIDALDKDFVIDLELQDWVNKEIFSKLYGIDINKIGFIMSKDFITQLSIEQMMSEDEAVNFNIAYFVNRFELNEWLKVDSLMGNFN